MTTNCTSKTKNQPWPKCSAAHTNGTYLFLFFLASLHPHSDILSSESIHSKFSQSSDYRILQTPHIVPHSKLNQIWADITLYNYSIHILQIEKQVSVMVMTSPPWELSGWGQDRLAAAQVHGRWLNHLDVSARVMESIVTMVYAYLVYLSTQYGQSLLITLGLSLS